jgi:L-ascorbate metabolism protein UlaG (beta-lactamase superfamily)
MAHATFLGHACVALTDGTHKMIIDPFLTDNPQASMSADKVECEYILLTHGHGDHVGDTFAIAKRTGATVIANFELANLCAKNGAEIHPMHIGGGYDFKFGRVKLTNALHGGGFGEHADTYTGPATGLLVTLDGKTVYHAGDTGLFSDMKLIGESVDIDVAFLPIGDNFTMGIEDAVKAVDFLRPRKVVPMHYNTWPVIEVDPEQFASQVSGSEVAVLKPGESIEF